MASTFRSLARAIGVPFVNLRSAQAVQLPPPPAILFDPGTRWYTTAERLPADRVFHLIRDPRDMVISGMHYHRTSEEPWLHKPRKLFGGKTYQQALNALPDDHARLLFEMERIAGSSLQVMLDWHYGRPECFECRYEDLSADTDLTLFTAACRHLGIPEDKLPAATECFRQHSLFSMGAKRPEHVRSGAPRQWQSVFDRTLAEAFDSRHGDALIALGYESDHSWVAACTESSLHTGSGGEVAPVLVPSSA